MKLNDNAEYSYSDRERELFSILIEGKRVDTIELSKKFYGKNPIPLNGSKIVFGAVAGLRRKIEANKEPFKIVSSKRSGPIPVSFWIEEKKRAKVRA
jgi:hypothetical protein